MKHTVTEILDVAVVTIALFAIIAIIQWMTLIGDAATGAKDGIVTQQINQTVDSIFDKTNESIGIEDTN